MDHEACWCAWCAHEEYCTDWLEAGFLDDNAFACDHVAPSKQLDTGNGKWFFVTFILFLDSAK